MANLEQIIRQLNPRELKAVRLSLANKPKMHDLLSAVLKHPDKNADFYAAKLGYTENDTAFFTLKHRFVDLIADEVFGKSVNPVVDLIQRTAVLRINLYSNCHELHKHELNRLMKIARRMDEADIIQQLVKLKLIYASREISGRKDIQKLKKAYAYYTDCKNILDEAEAEFYNYLFSENISPFHLTKDKMNTVRETFASYLEKYSHNHTLFFLTESIFIEQELRSGQKPLNTILKRIEKLEKIYRTSFLKYKYPLADVGLAVMKNKYYFLCGQREEFRQSFDDQKHRFVLLAANPMYAGVQVYLIFAHYYAHETGNLTEQELDAFLEKCAANTHPLTQIALHFCGACRDYNRGQFYEASKKVSRARQYLNVSIRINTLLPLEISILGLLIQLAMPDSRTDLINYELNALKYAFQGSAFEKPEPINQLIRLTKQAMAKNNYTDLHKSLPEIKQALFSHNLIRLLDNFSDISS